MYFYFFMTIWFLVGAKIQNKGHLRKENAKKAIFHRHARQFFKVLVSFVANPERCRNKKNRKRMKSFRTTGNRLTFAHRKQQTTSTKKTVIKTLPVNSSVMNIRCRIEKESSIHHHKLSVKFYIHTLSFRLFRLFRLLG